MLERTPSFRALLPILGLASGLAGPPFLMAAAQTELLQAQERESDFTMLQSAQLAAMLRKKDFFFVNVHIPYEGEIKDTDAFIPYDKITENLHRLPEEKNAKIIFYCRSGRMSELAAQELVRLGYTQISHLVGGMIDWKKSGFPILEKEL